MTVALGTPPLAGRLLAAAIACLASIGITGCASRPAETAAVSPAPASASDDREAVLLFRQAVEAYATLHRRLAQGLPRLAADASPEAVHAREVAFENLIAGERRTNARGDLFVAPIQPVIRRVATQMLTGPDGPSLVDTITEESTERRRGVRINARYPDDIPLSSMPAQLLNALPPLPEELEYRFVGRDLILLDTKARLIADVMPGVLPR